MKKTILAAAFSLALIAPAFAIDFSAEIKTFDGKSFTDQSGAPSPVILGNVIESMLLNPPQGTAEDEKKRRFWLSLKLHEHRKDPDLTNDELKMVRKAAFEYPVLSVAGQAARLVDPEFVDPNGVPKK